MRTFRASVAIIPALQVAHLLPLLFITYRSNYAKYMPVVMLQMRRLPVTVTESFRDGHFVSKLWSVCNNTPDARDGDVFTVCAVASAPAVMLTIRDARFHSTAFNFVQPNLSATGTVAVTNEPSTVSAYVMIDHKCLSTSQLTTHQL